HLHAETAGDLVAHAGVAVLDVVALRVLRAPQLVEVARHGPRGARADVSRAADLVDGADDLGLRGQPPVLGRVRPVALGVPLGGQGPCPLPVGAGRAVAGQGGVQGADALLRVRDDGDAPELGGVEPGDVDVDELHVRVAEQAPGRGREVAVAGADAEDDIGLARERVRRGGARRAYGDR